MTVLTITRFTFKEALRKKVLFGAIVLSLLFLTLYALGNYLAQAEFVRETAEDAARGRQAAFDPRNALAAGMTIAGLYVVNFLAGLLAIFTAVGTISSEIDSGTLHAVLPKPVRRWEVVLGKWLGFALMLVVYVVAMGGAIVTIASTVWSVAPPNAAAALAFMSLCTLMLLGLTVLGSTLLPTVTNGIVVFMLYGVGLMGGFIEQIGSVFRNETMVNIGIFTSLLVPSDILWKMASYSVQPEDVLIRTATLPIFGGAEPTAPMLGYVLVYMAAAVLLATLAFNRRDL
jgi:ABC-type transport system involved in multi-copper enzyme maturation permease subunit